MKTTRKAFFKQLSKMPAAEQRLEDCAFAVAEAHLAKRFRKSALRFHVIDLPRHPGVEGIPQFLQKNGWEPLISNLLLRFGPRGDDPQAGPIEGILFVRLTLDALELRGFIPSHIGAISELYAEHLYSFYRAQNKPSSQDSAGLAAAPNQQPKEGEEQETTTSRTVISVPMTGAWGELVSALARGETYHPRVAANLLTNILVTVPEFAQQYNAVALSTQLCDIRLDPDYGPGMPIFFTVKGSDGTAAAYSLVCAPKKSTSSDAPVQDVKKEGRITIFVRDEDHWTRLGSRAWDLCLAKGSTDTIDEEIRRKQQLLVVEIFAAAASYNWGDYISEDLTKEIRDIRVIIDYLNPNTDTPVVSIEFTAVNNEDSPAQYGFAYAPVQQ